MKKNSFRLEYAFYIIIIPIVLVMILLNSGYLQRWFTAVTVDGEDYNAVGYNYYYFRCYRDFVDSEDFASSGLDLTVSLSDQQYDETATWKDHFTAQAEERMVLTTIMTVWPGRRATPSPRRSWHRSRRSWTRYLSSARRPGWPWRTISRLTMVPG